jgi:hypothetical protein
MITGKFGFAGSELDRAALSQLAIVVGAAIAAPDSSSGHRLIAFAPPKSPGRGSRF